MWPTGTDHVLESDDEEPLAYVKRVGDAKLRSGRGVETTRSGGQRR